MTTTLTITVTDSDGIILDEIELPVEKTINSIAIRLLSPGECDNRSDGELGPGLIQPN